MEGQLLNGNSLGDSTYVNSYEDLEVRSCL